MAKLVLSMDGLVLKEIPLVTERLTIGRRANNDIQIDNLAISGQHAVVVTILNDSFLEDLNSTNGTMVNGQPVKKHFLKNGDDIELAKYKLKYVIDPPSPVGETTDYGNTVTMTAEKPQKPMPAAAAPASTPAPEQKSGGAAAALSAASASASPSASASVKILNGSNAGRTVELTKVMTTLGKPGVQVAVIANRAQGFSITHVEGAQVPLVNGLAIDAQARGLSDHDIIEIAGVRMEFILKK